MAKRGKNGFDIKMLLEYSEKLEALGGSQAMERATEAAMIQAKQTINQQVTAAMQPGNLPAGGKYSTGDTLRSLDKSYKVRWAGNLAQLPVGFNLDESGLASIMLTHGTPTMPPVAGLADALYGKTARRIARKAQEEALQKVLKRIGG